MPTTPTETPPRGLAARREQTAAFIERTTLRDLFDIPTELIERAKNVAYACHQTGRHQETQILCRGLLAVDHRCWWTHALYAASLHRCGSDQEALVVVERGLRHHPAHATLLAQRRELLGRLNTSPAIGAAAPLPEAA